MLVALFSFAIIYYIMQQNICMFDTVFGIKVRMSCLCINRYRLIIGCCLIGASIRLTVTIKLTDNYAIKD